MVRKMNKMELTKQQKKELKKQEECKHNWKKIYYRKINNKKIQEWITIPNKFICDKCMEIKELR